MHLLILWVVPQSQLVRLYDFLYHHFIKPLPLPMFLVVPVGLLVERYFEGADTGGWGARPIPLFLSKSILFSTLYTMSEKIRLKINLDFIVAEIRGVFGSVGVYACVCESKSWPLLFFVLQRPNFELYPRPFWSQKYMPDCRWCLPRKFWRSVRGFAPLPGPPFQNSWIRPYFVCKISVHIHVAVSDVALFSCSRAN